MQIPILNGVYTDSTPDFRVSYPFNMMPIPKQEGISNGYLKISDGILAFTGTGPGATRGGINWNGSCYRVMGTKFVKEDSNGTITIYGDVGGTEEVTMDYSFDYLSITSNNNLYLFDGVTLRQNTDIDLGNALDHIFIDGYFLTTDGTYLAVTELTDPFSVNPLKYGSSEVDPDPIKAVKKLNNEPYAINRYTIEVFQNIGGTGFPYQRIEGAVIERGSIGTHTCCVFMDSIAFMGGGKKESIAIWLGSNGRSLKLSTTEVDIILSEYTEETLSQIRMETRSDKNQQLLYVHLPDQTLVYDNAATQLIGEPVWFVLGSGYIRNTQYLGKNFVYCYNKWLVGNPVDGKHGYLTNSTSQHWGNDIGWEFNTVIVYNEGRRAIVHELELVALTGRVPFGESTAISTRWSTDGETWSMEKSINSGGEGERNKRLSWLDQGFIEHWRIQQFKGVNNAKLAVARLEARLEGLNG